MGILIRELSTLYEAFQRREASPLAELAIQYGDFAEWQRSWLEGEVLETQLRFWTQRLAGTESRASLPLDRARTAQVGRRGAQRDFHLGSDTTAALEEIARGHGVTLFMLLLAAVQTLLWRYGGGEETSVVGTPIAGRNRLETEPLIGFFVNTLVLASRLGDDPGFSGLLERTREEVLSAFAHQEVPFEKLVEEIAPQREATRTPLFDVLFALQTVEAPAVELPGLRMAGVEEPEEAAAKLDLSLILSAGDRGLAGGFSYDPSLFDAATVERLGAHLAALLGSVAAAPERRLSELPLLGQAERHALLREWSDTAPSASVPACLHELVEAQVLRTPEAVAVVGAEGVLSYAELERRAERLSRRLRARGVGPERCVGVLLERTPDLVVALLAVLEAGGAYVPLDAAYPAARLGFMLDDSGARVVLTRRALLASLGPLPEGVEPVFLEPGWEREPAAEAVRTEAPDPGNLAYLIYTSGSTGVPKAVALEHRSAVAFVRWAWEVYPPEELAGVLGATSIGFDMSVFELFVPLSRGGKVLLAANVLALAELPGAAAVTLVNTVPSAMAELVAAGVLPAAVRTVNLGGEPVSRALAEAVHGCGRVSLYNLYGPSEDTTFSTIAALGRETREAPAIGRPVAGTQVYLLDWEHRPVPLGAPGEVYLGGAGLSRGYYGRADLTAERFVPNPYAELVGSAGSRLYRTGDLGRLRPEGELEFLGRIDQQVKVRGFRVEPGEIESALLAHAGVRQAAVVAREEASGDRHLVAYVTFSTEPVAARELREFLRGRLPEPMVPSAFLSLPSLPRTASGKIDRRALPASEMVDAGERSSLPPRSLLELELVRIFEELLGVEPVGVHDDFFALGGHSLLAVRAVARIQRQTGRQLSLAQLLREPTVERLAATLRHRQPAARSSLVEIQPAGSKVPLFWVHPVGGHILCYLELSRRLGQDQPFYAFRARGLEQGEACLASIASMAAEYCDELVRFQPQEPYLLGGWSMGGLIAYEMAQRLLAEGREVRLLVLLDTPAPDKHDAVPRSDVELLAAFATDLGLGREALASLLKKMQHPLKGQDWVEEILKAARRVGVVPPDLETRDLHRLFEVFRVNARGVEEYQAQPYSGRLTVVVAEKGRRPGDQPSLGWESLAAGGLEVWQTPGDHYCALREPQVKSLAERMAILARAAVSRGKIQVP
jgi:amino acid adenylation domain-containing protein